MLVLGSTVCWTVARDKNMLFLVWLCSVCTAAYVVLNAHRNLDSSTNPSPCCSEGDRLHFITDSPAGGFFPKTFLPPPTPGYLLV